MPCGWYCRAEGEGGKNHSSCLRSQPSWRNMKCWSSRCTLWRWRSKQHLQKSWRKMGFLVNVQWRKTEKYVTQWFIFNSWDHFTAGTDPVWASKKHSFVFWHFPPYPLSALTAYSTQFWHPALPAVSAHPFQHCDQGPGHPLLYFTKDFSRSKGYPWCHLLWKPWWWHYETLVPAILDTGENSLTDSVASLSHGCFLRTGSRASLFS